MFIFICYFFKLSFYFCLMFVYITFCLCTVYNSFDIKIILYISHLYVAWPIGSCVVHQHVQQWFCLFSLKFLVYFLCANVCFLRWTHFGHILCGCMAFCRVSILFHVLNEFRCYCTVFGTSNKGFWDCAHNDSIWQLSWYTCIFNKGYNSFVWTVLQFLSCWRQPLNYRGQVRGKLFWLFNYHGWVRHEAILAQPLDYRGQVRRKSFWLLNCYGWVRHEAIVVQLLNHHGRVRCQAILAQLLNYHDRSIFCTVSGFHGFSHSTLTCYKEM